MTPDLLRGISNQDQDCQSLLEVWNRSDTDAQSQLVEVFEIDANDVDAIAKWYDEAPVEWLSFLTLCALVGLRQAIINKSLVEGGA